MPKEEYFSNNYSIQLKNLVRLILRMKLYASKILGYAEEMLKEYNPHEKQKIMEFQKKLKAAGIELEDSVTKIIALSQPVAFDLRFILSSLKISSEIRYIANWIRKSVKAIERIGQNEILTTSKGQLIEMVDISFTQLKGIISILLQFDSKQKAASEILVLLDEMLEKDSLVDNIYKKILEDGLAAIKNNQSDPITIFEIIGIAKNFEKVSDCINNIISTTRYVLTGKRIQV